MERKFGELERQFERSRIAHTMSLSRKILKMFQKYARWIPAIVAAVLILNIWTEYYAAPWRTSLQRLRGQNDHHAPEQVAEAIEQPDASQDASGLSQHPAAANEGAFVDPGSLFQGISTLDTDPTILTSVEVDVPLAVATETTTLPTTTMLETMETETATATMTTEPTTIILDLNNDLSAPLHLPALEDELPLPDSTQFHAQPTSIEDLTPAATSLDLSVGSGNADALLAPLPVELPPFDLPLPEPMAPAPPLNDPGLNTPQISPPWPAPTASPLKKAADTYLGGFEDIINNIPALTLEEAKSTCTWGEHDLPPFAFMYGDDVEWVVTEKSDEELSARRQEWHEYLRDGLVPWSSAADRYSGRGIIIVAGNANTKKRVRFLLQLLLAHGSRLPVEILYWTSEEISDEEKRDYHKVHPYLYFKDLSDQANDFFHTLGPNPYVPGYMLKTTAVLNSRFAEVLLLDSDILPTMDPEALFESETFRNYGSVFWPDIVRTRPNNPMWAITNTPCRMDEWEQESGQLLVDKRRFFYHLQLAAWYNQRGYYNEFLLGDKDMFRFAWHALRTPFGTPARWMSFIGTAIEDSEDIDIQDTFCGRSFAQHHPDKNNGSVAFLHANGLKRMHQVSFEYFREESSGGVFGYYQSTELDGDPFLHQHAELIGENWIAYLDSVPEGFAPVCSYMFGIRPRPAEEVIPGFEALLRRLNAYEVFAETINS